MAGISLLDKTRRIETLLHNNVSSKVAFSDICRDVSETLTSYALVISRKGKVLGVGEGKDIRRIDELLSYEVGGYIDGALNGRFLSILSTQENAGLLALGFSWNTVKGFDRRSGQSEAPGGVKEYRTMITPIYIRGERLGTLLIYREEDMFDIDDIILAEYAATVVGLELMRAKDEEHKESDIRVKNVNDVLGATSPSEMESVKAVLSKLGPEGAGTVNLTKLSEETGISRTSLVNAVRKMTGAGVFMTHSRGVRGTEVKVINRLIYEQTGIKETE